MLILLTTLSCLYGLITNENVYDKRFIINKGQGIVDISDIIFEDNKSLKFALIANLYYHSKINKHYVIPGEYSLKGRFSISKISKELISGNRVVRKIIIPEGFNIFQIKKLFERSEGLIGVFPDAVEEGSLMPDTYHYFWGDKISDIVHKMHNEMEKFTNQIFKPNDQIADINKMLTLASIVEKETSHPSERSMIAGVYLNRLKLGMILQADPTVIYGITNGQTDFNYKLTKNDLLTYTVFNTYMLKGLPPTPIGCPGKDSIIAVMHPLDTNNFYFVADGTGKHNFAVNLQNHNINVKNYRDQKKLIQVLKKDE